MAKWYTTSVIYGVSSSSVRKTYTVAAASKLEALRNGHEKALKAYPCGTINTIEAHLIRA